MSPIGRAGFVVAARPASPVTARSVVDARLLVRGVAALRVIDASVMPAVASGNINAAVIAIAEKGAELVLEDAASGG